MPNQALHRTAAKHASGESERLGGAAVGELSVRRHRIYEHYSTTTAWHLVGLFIIVGACYCVDCFFTLAGYRKRFVR
jgi:hypothetical protein